MNPPFDNAVPQMKPQPIKELAIQKTLREISELKDGSILWLQPGVSIRDATIQMFPVTELARARWWASGWTRAVDSSSRRPPLLDFIRRSDRSAEATKRLLAATNPNP